MLLGCDSSDNEAKSNGATDSPYENPKNFTFRVYENSTDPVFNIFDSIVNKEDAFEAILGYDEALFGYDETTGDIFFLEVPNYDLPKDDDFDNDYVLKLDLNSGEREITLTIKILDVEEDFPDDNFHELTPWTTYRGNAQHTGYVPMRIDENSISLLWVKQTDFSMNAIVAYGDLAFVSEFEDASRIVSGDPYKDPSVLAVDILTGDIVWERSHDEFHQNSPSLPNAGDSFAPPAYSDGKVYIGSYSSHSFLSKSSGYKFLALDASNGSVIFENEDFSPVMNFPVTPHDGVVYFREAAPSDPTYTGTQRIVGLSETSGALEWIFDLYSTPYFNSEFTAVPTLTDNRLFIAATIGGTRYYKFDLERQELESTFLFSCGDDGEFVADQSPLNAIPYISENSLIYATDDCVASFKPEFSTLGGESKWLTLQKEARYYDIYADQDNIYAISATGFDVFNRAGGGKKSSYKYANYAYKSAILTQDHLLISQRNQTIIVRLSDLEQVGNLSYGGNISLTDDGYLLISGNRFYSAYRVVN